MFFPIPFFIIVDSIARALITLISEHPFETIILAIAFLFVVIGLLIFKKYTKNDQELSKNLLTLIEYSNCAIAALIFFIGLTLFNFNSSRYSGRYYTCNTPTKFEYLS